MEELSYMRRDPTRSKSPVVLVRTDGNMFVLIGTAIEVLKKEGRNEEAEEMARRVRNYDEALKIVTEYIEVS